MVRRHSARRKKKTTRRKRTQRGGGFLSTLGKAASLGVKLGKDKRYKRMGAVGAKGHYTAHRRPWVKLPPGGGYLLSDFAKKQIARARAARARQ